ncbi:inorganic diphosphatase [Catenulispora subtropica]|uniref:Inorganic pyrophosphatase n=1 Tax=Catenulispora subtropica TaxID=450798 RepID=A0ABN2SAC9_9ACTN
MQFDVVIEIPAGSRNKYVMDHQLGRIRLERQLFTSTSYPADYGYIPDTLALDGDPLDAMVLLDDPVFPGVQVSVRPVGVYRSRDEEGVDDKILCVPAGDHRYEEIQDLGDVAEERLQEIGHFFDVYKDTEPGRHAHPGRWADRAAAEAVITADLRRGETNG